VIENEDMLELTAVSSGCVISSFRLNLTVQTLVGSFPGVIVPIPLHTVNIISHQKNEKIDFKVMIQKLNDRIK
jgi:hypothetical protein